MDFERCTEESNNRIVSVSEKGKKFVISNEKKVCIKKVRVDGCLIDDERERCDYLFVIYDPATLVIYLELKGRDLPKAYSQLVATIGYCKEAHKGLAKRCYIVASRVPRANPKVQVLQKKLTQNHGAQLVVQTRSAEVCV